MAGSKEASLCTACGARMTSSSDSVPHSPQPVRPASARRRAFRATNASLAISISTATPFGRVTTSMP
ncbi:hypothetical protein D3C86_1532100 [compost metagenome]